MPNELAVASETATWSIGVATSPVPSVMPEPSPSLYGVFDQMRFGLVIIDRNLHVKFANEVARTMARRRDGIEFKGNAIVFVKSRAVKWFPRLAALDLAASDSGFAFRIAREEDRPDFHAMVTRTSVASLAKQNQSTYCIWIFDTIIQRRIELRFLQELHGLTYAESVVVAALFRGLTLDEVASELAVSVNTVKTHLKHTFQKCEVRSQAELLQMLALGPR